MMKLRRSSASVLVFFCACTALRAQTRPTDGVTTPGGPSVVAPVAPSANALGVAPSVTPLTAAVPVTAAPTATTTQAPAHPAATQAPVAIAAHPQSAAAQTHGAPSTAAHNLDSARTGLREARSSDAKAGGVESSEQELDRVFDAAMRRAALESGAVEGRIQSARAVIVQKALVGNVASPSDAPALYLAAIEAARTVLPKEFAADVMKIVLRAASRKAEFSLPVLASALFEAAHAGQGIETKRLTDALERWEALLGSSERPLITNGAELKGVIADMLAKGGLDAAQRPSGVRIQKMGLDSYRVIFPGSGIAAVKNLAQRFALALSEVLPEESMTAYHERFSASPGASVGARLIYSAFISQRRSVPAAAFAAGRFWLRSVLESLWRVFLSLWRDAPVVAVSTSAEREDLARRSASVSAASEKAASARRQFSAPETSVAAVRRGFELSIAAAMRLAEYESSARAAAGALSHLAHSFDEATAVLGLRPGDAVAPSLFTFISGADGAEHWLDLIDRRAAQFAPLGASAPSGLTALDDGSGVTHSAASWAKEFVRAPVSLVTVDGRLLARGAGPSGLVTMTARLSATTNGGGIQLSVEKFDADLERRLENLGLTVERKGAGMSATLEGGDFSRDADDVALVSARALQESVGSGPRMMSSVQEAEALGRELTRDRATAAELARRLDGREAFADAPILGRFGAYEVIGPVPVVLNGTPVQITALRDPWNSLLAYARASRPDGGALGSAQLRALLRTK